MVLLFTVCTFQAEPVGSLPLCKQMHAIRVQNTVQPGFAKANAANNERVMAVLREAPIPGVSTSASLKDDGQTFVHLVMATDEEQRAKISELPAFQEFQAALQASGPVSPPAKEALRVVGSSLVL